jgi:uncharacterized protein with HEPN domain
MQPRTVALLSHIAEFSRDILVYTRGMTFDEYLHKKLIRHAVERILHTLGEAAIRLQNFDPQTLALLPGSFQIVGLRHRLAHGYMEDIDDEII